MNLFDFIPLSWTNDTLLLHCMWRNHVLSYTDSGRIYTGREGELSPKLVLGCLTTLPLSPTRNYPLFRPMICFALTKWPNFFKKISQPFSNNISNDLLVQKRPFSPKIVLLSPLPCLTPFLWSSHRITQFFGEKNLSSSFDCYPSILVTSKVEQPLLNLI